MCSIQRERQRGREIGRSWGWGPGSAWRRLSTSSLTYFSPRPLLRDMGKELEEMEEEQAVCQAWDLFQYYSLQRWVTSLVVLSSARELCGNVSMRPLPCPALLPTLMRLSVARNHERF